MERSENRRFSAILTHSAICDASHSKQLLVLFDVVTSSSVLATTT